MLLPAWVYVTVQVPVAAVIVIVAEPVPLPEQAPLAAILTGKSELTVAATGNVLPSAALAGAAVVTMIVWSVRVAAVAVVELVTVGAAA
jgi:hypothetical protein